MSAEDRAGHDAQHSDRGGGGSVQKGITGVQSRRTSEEAQARCWNTETVIVAAVQCERKRWPESAAAALGQMGEGSRQ